MALDTVLAPTICKAAACTEHLLMPTSQGQALPLSLSMPGTHTNSTARPPPHSLCFAAPCRLLGIFKSSFFNPKTSQIFLCPAKLCGIYRIRASSNARETGQMSLCRCISLLLTFTLPLPFTNSAGREREQRFKERQYRNIFKSPFITCILWD